MVCRPVHNIGTWLPGNCLSYGCCSILCECLPKALYDEKCIQKTGHHATFKKNSYILICDPSSPGTADDREQSMCVSGLWGVHGHCLRHQSLAWALV